MSSRHTRSFFGVMLAVVFAFSAVIAVPASAKLSKSQKVHIRHQLRKQIKKHPKMIRNKHWLKKAALVNFKLPVTLRLRSSDNAPPAGPPFFGPGSKNPNAATVDLGASLGSRAVALGGSLAAEITFSDSYDGGALGNVKLDILESNTKKLSSTSIPLLWNTQVTSGRFDYNDLFGVMGGTSGCGNLTGASHIPFGLGVLSGVSTGSGLPGYPVGLSRVSNTNAGTTTGFLPIDAGVNDVHGQIVAGDKPGGDNIVGPSPQPFPSPIPAQENPDGTTYLPSVEDTVLRTNALSLGVAHPGTSVPQENGSAGAEGSQNIVIGKSGGEANLFGNIPGKTKGIDVTVSLATRINSIIRVVDQDSYHTGVAVGDHWPAGLFNCQQVWTGGVDNYIPDVRLVGNLKIAPGLTADGHLRIAKAKVQSQDAIAGPGSGTRFAVAACLFPYSTYARETGTNSVVQPTGTVSPLGLPYASSTQLPVDPTQLEGKPGTGVACNTADTLVQQSTYLNGQPGFGGLPNLASLTGASSGNGYTTASNGSKVTVAADLNVTNVDIDVLIGDV